MIFVQKWKIKKVISYNAYLFGYDNKENENPKNPQKVKSTGGLQDVVARFTTHTILNDDGEVGDGDDGGGGGGGRGAAGSPHADGAVLDVPVQ